MTEKPAIMSLEQARQTMLSGVSVVSSKDGSNTEVKPLVELAGRILAEDIISPLDAPPNDNSAMDGYAFRQVDIEQGAHCRLIGKSLAGLPFEGTVANGECVRITTGASMPAGADTVVIQENVNVEGETILFVEPSPSRGANVRYRGEDVALGDKVLSAGRRIGAIEVGVLATLGFAEAPVRKLLRVALFVSGDELRGQGEQLGPGDIYESNRHVLRVMLQKLGVEVVDLGVVPDDPDQLRKVCLEGNRRADVVITCGGASVGEADYAREVLQDVGKLDFWKVAIKPGKPFIYGRMDSSLFFGLPGNPVSALVTFQQLVVPVLRKLQGADDPEPLRLSARITQSLRPNRKRLELMRAYYRPTASGNSFEVTPDRQQSSGAFGVLARCNCFIWVAAGSEVLPEGSLLPVLPFDELLNGA